MHKGVILAALLGLAISTSGLASDDAQGHIPAEIAPAFKMKRCVNMGNALETPRLSDWGGRFYNKDDYERIAAAGFDTVRIPIRWNAYTGPRPQHRIHPDLWQMVDDQIVWASEAGLNVIINVHHFDKMMEDPDGQVARFQLIWAQIADRYKVLPDTVWFEVLNEPHKNLKGRSMRKAQALALSIIRERDPDRIVILGGEEWSGITSLGSNLSTDDPNVVYTFHYYDPFSFTHQQATWLGDNMPKGKRGWGSDTDKAELANAVEIATGFRDAVKRPVFLGEFGANEPIENSERVEYAGAVKTAMEAAGIPWCLWAYSNTFPLYRDGRGWDENMLAALTSDTASAGE